MQQFSKNAIIGQRDTGRESRSGTHIAVTLFLLLSLLFSPGAKALTTTLMKVACTMTAERPVIVPIEVDNYLQLLDMSRADRKQQATRLARQATRDARRHRDRLIAFRLDVAHLSYEEFTSLEKSDIAARVRNDLTPSVVYEEMIASLLVNFLNDYNQMNSGRSVTIFGLPLETVPGYSGRAVDRTNNRYADVIVRSDGFVSSKSYVYMGYENEYGRITVEELAQNALSMAFGRTFTVRRRGGWLNVDTDNTDNRGNSSPLAKRDQYEVDENESLSISAPGILRNDSDPDRDRITAELVASPISGSLRLRSDGSFTYRPNDDFSGTDYFSYRARDENDNRSVTSNVLIIVNGPGHDAKVIARWDVVPYQTFDGDFNVGVVAFHMNGIDRVDFSVNGGQWIPVSEMQLNDRTGVWEYFITLHASNYEDGPMEVRAVAWPKDTGEPRVLQGEITPESVRNGQHSMVISANANGSLPQVARYVSPNGDDNLGDGTEASPLQTIGAAIRSISSEQGDLSIDGGVIYLMAGDHNFGAYVGPVRLTPTRWLTITGAPGTTRSEVRITSTSGGSDVLRVRLVHIDGITITSSLLSTSGKSAWVSNCTLDGGGANSGEILWFPETRWNSGVYATDLIIQHATVGIKPSALQRDVVMTDIGGDGFRNPSLVINCSVKDLQSNNGYHTDVIQWYGAGMDNKIIYGLTAVENIHAQGIFCKSHANEAKNENFAIVNVLLDPSSTNLSQWTKSTDHLLIWNSTILSRAFNFNDVYDEPTALPNISIKNSIFSEVWFAPGGGPFIEQVNASNNHFINGVALGTTSTNGPPMFIDRSAFDYSPASNSPLKSRVDPIDVPVDIANIPLVIPAAVGAVQPAQ